MIALPAAELAAVLGADLVGPGDPAALVSAVTADSRSVAPGALFVALPGTRADGHAFVPTAYAAGAAAALTRHPVPDVLCLVVADPLVALGRLARHLVDRGAAAGLRVVGITGSQGKTSTKDLLSQVLESAGPTVAPAGNLNNELGVPLTVSRIDEHTRFLVAEMGARGIGHIAYLCDIAPPTVGVVLNVGHAHIGEFGGQAAIARAKGELVEALPATGTAVLNAEDPLVWAMRERTAAPVLAFSAGETPPDPGVWATDLAGDPSGRYTFRLHAAGLGSSAANGQAVVRLQVPGRHQVGNALAAAAAALALGLDLDQVAEGLSRATARSRWRMELHQRDDGVTVLNDAYNANPDSMAAAVGTLAELSGQRSRRTWAVLGDMLELGDEADRAHADLGALVATSGIDRLVVVGAYAEPMAAAARGRRAGRRGGAGIPGQGRGPGGGARRAHPRRRRAGQGVAWLSLGHRGGGDPGVPARPPRDLHRTGGAFVRTIVLAGGIALLGTLFGTRLAIRVLVRQGLRPADSRRRADLPPRQARHPDHGWAGHHRRGTGRLRRRHLIVLTPAVGLRVADPVPVHRAGRGRLPGRLHQDPQPAFARAAEQGQDRRSVDRRESSSPCCRCSSPTIGASRRPRSTSPSCVTSSGCGCPVVLVVIWVILLIAASSNGVNLTDGLDGLAAGACVMIFGAYMLVNLWQYNQSCAYTGSAGPKCYEVRDPYDLAVVAVALAGACFGFLWWNAEPAKIFMGDTGSLSLGGALAGMAIFSRTEILLVILGGLLVVEVMSVILQIGFFKLTKGRRLFKMSPLHHHFEMLNWAQVTIVMRFWIICGLFVTGGPRALLRRMGERPVTRRACASRTI